jgi:hypothetical protein
MPDNPVPGVTGFVALYMWSLVFIAIAEVSFWIWWQQLPQFH